MNLLVNLKPSMIFYFNCRGQFVFSLISCVEVVIRLSLPVTADWPATGESVADSHRGLAGHWQVSRRLSPRTGRPLAIQSQTLTVDWPATGKSVADSHRGLAGQWRVSRRLSPRTVRPVACQSQTLTADCPASGESVADSHRGLAGHWRVSRRLSPGCIGTVNQTRPSYTGHW